MNRDYLVPRELPTAPAVFVGRDREIQMLREKLDAHEGDTPFVALLSGRGGIGKTALALSFAHRVYDRFPDGQMFVRVASWDATSDIEGQVPPYPRTADLVASVARNLVLALRKPGDEVPDISRRAELSGLYRTLAQDRRLVIVLDDVPESVDLSPILTTVTPSAIIITARKPPPDISVDFSIPLEPLNDNDALELLEKAIGKERVNEEEKRPSKRLVELCKREPLALRLAGAALAGRPHWRLSLARDLVDRAKDDPAEVESLDAAYRLLTEDEQRALRCIGAIGSSQFSSWALRATLDDHQGDEAHALASRLARARLIERTSAGAGGVPVYEVPEPVVKYVRGLTRDEDIEVAVDRLRSQRAERQHERPNKWIREQVYPLMREGSLSDAVERARDTLVLVGEHPDQSAEAACFAALAELYAELGEISAAEDAAEYALKKGNPDSRARALRSLAKLQTRAHRFAKAEHYLDLGLESAQAADDTGEEIRILADRALVRGRRSEFSGALDDAHHAIALCKPGEIRQLPITMLAYGAVCMYVGAAEQANSKRRNEYFARAESAFARGYRQAHSGSFPQQVLAMSWIRHAQARLAIEKGEWEQAKTQASEAVALFTDKRHRYGAAHCRLLLGTIHLRSQQPEEAVGELLSALETFRNCGDARVAADVSLLLAQAFLKLGKRDQARRLQESAVDGYLGLNDRFLAREAAIAVTATRLMRFRLRRRRTGHRAVTSHV